MRNEIESSFLISHFSFLISHFLAILAELAGLKKRMFSTRSRWRSSSNSALVLSAGHLERPSPLFCVDSLAPLPETS